MGHIPMIMTAPERSAPGRPGSGREGVAQVRHDVADGDLDHGQPACLLGKVREASR